MITEMSAASINSLAMFRAWVMTVTDRAGRSDGGRISTVVVPQSKITVGAVETCAFGGRRLGESAR
jgi:hypothetical protein